jgi:hypothetical protein
MGRKDYKPYMSMFRHMDMPPAPAPAPEIRHMDAPFAGKRHKGRRVDIETGDLILDEPSQQEYLVIKRNMMGDIIDLYRVETDDEIR